MKRALIEGTRVAQIVEPGEEFEVASPLSWVDVANTTTTRDTYQGGVVIPDGTYLPSGTLSEAVTRKKQQLAEAFTDARDGGTTVTIDSTPVGLATTHDAQQELREVANRLSGGGTQKGVTRSGAPIVFTTALANACLQAVNDHHAACNAVEYDHLVAILVLTTIAEVDAYDVTTAWPAGS